MLRRFQRIGLLASIAAYCAVMAAMGLHKHFPALDLEILSASRMLCLAAVVAFCLPAVRSVRMSDKLVGALGTTVVATILFVLDMIMLAEVAFGRTDSSQWNAWVGLLFIGSFYGAFALITLGIGAALEGTRFAKPLWKNPRTSENFMASQKHDKPRR